MNAIVIDVNNILYRALAIKQYLKFREKSTTGLYGFLEQFFSNVNTFKPEYIICTLDKKPYIRSEMFDAFKAGRIKEDFDPLKAQVLSEGLLYIRDFLDKCHIPLWEVKGLEADDLIAIACNKLSSMVDKVVVISNDDDLYQLLDNEKVYLYTKNKVLFGKAEFTNLTGLTDPKDWIKYGALAGTHNGPKGIKGIGKVTALKILKEGRWKDYENNPTIKRDIQLITLPIKEVEQPIYKYEVNYRKVFNYLITEYGFKIESYIDRALVFLEKGT